MFKTGACLFKSVWREWTVPVLIKQKTASPDKSTQGNF